MPGIVDSSKTSPKAAIRLNDTVGKTATVSSAIIPHLMVHEGMRQSLERRLSQVRSGPAILSITDNRTSIIVHSVRKGILHARVHFMFLDAPPNVMSALVSYLIRSDKESGFVLDDYIANNGAKLARKRPKVMSVIGKTHNLEAIFNEINAKYFHGTCTADITWGRKPNRPKDGKPRQTIRLGSYAYLERLITIHPALDMAWVPKYFIACVVYHEMLHHMIPSARGTYSPKNLSSPRVLHPPEFLEREKLFKQFDKAIEWEKRNISRILRTSSSKS